MQFTKVDGQMLMSLDKTIECDDNADAYFCLEDGQQIYIYEAKGGYEVRYEDMATSKGTRISGTFIDSTLTNAFSTMGDLIINPPTEDDITMPTDREALGLMFDAWNKAEFGGELAPIDIVCAGKNIHLKDALGSYVDDAYEIGMGEVIIIDMGTVCKVAEEVEDTGVSHIMADTLLHEMVHYWCHSKGIADALEDGTHTEAYRDAAIAHGLECREGSQGYNNTRTTFEAWVGFGICQDERLEMYMEERQ